MRCEAPAPVRTSWASRPVGKHTALVNIYYGLGSSCWSSCGNYRPCVLTLVSCGFGRRFSAAMLAQRLLTTELAHERVQVGLFHTPALRYARPPHPRTAPPASVAVRGGRPLSRRLQTLHGPARLTEPSLVAVSVCADFLLGLCKKLSSQKASRRGTDLSFHTGERGGTLTPACMLD